MAAHLGTGIQIAAIGPQNKYLDIDPQVTMFRKIHKQSTMFASEAMEDLPLQSVKFGSVATFEMPPRGDLLGTMHVQIEVPAIQRPLGLHIAPPLPFPLAPPTTSPGTVETDEVGLEVDGRVLSVALAVPSEVDTVPLPTGDGRAWFFEECAVFIYSNGRLEITCPSTTSLGTVVVRVAGNPVLTLHTRPNSSVAVHVSSDDTVSTENDVWPERLAYVLMRRARFLVDDLVLHDHERLWYHMLDALSTRSGHESGLREMLGTGLSMGKAHTVLLPLKFFGNNAHFPVALVPKCRVVVELDVETFAACLPARTRSPCTEPPSLALRLVAEHIFLDAPERNVMLSKKEWVLMYEGAQDVDALNYVVSNDGVTSYKPDVAVDLSELNLPVKALVWVVYPEQVSTMFEYLDAVDNAVLLFGSLERMTGTGGMFSKQQVWSHGTRCQPGNVYVYSFALATHDATPSGTANFSVLAKPVLRVRFKPEYSASQLKCKVWGMTYNWLKFHGGTVTHMFST